MLALRCPGSQHGSRSRCLRDVQYDLVLQCSVLTSGVVVPALIACLPITMVSPPSPTPPARLPDVACAASARNETRGTVGVRTCFSCLGRGVPGPVSSGVARAGSAWVLHVHDRHVDPLCSPGPDLGRCRGLGLRCASTPRKTLDSTSLSPLSLDTCCSSGALKPRLTRLHCEKHTLHLPLVLFHHGEALEQPANFNSN